MSNTQQQKKSNNNTSKLLAHPASYLQAPPPQPQLPNIQHKSDEIYINPYRQIRIRHYEKEQAQRKQEQNIKKEEEQKYGKRRQQQQHDVVDDTIHRIGHRSLAASPELKHGGDDSEPSSRRPSHIDQLDRHSSSPQTSLLDDLLSSSALTLDSSLGAGIGMSDLLSRPFRREFGEENILRHTPVEQTQEVQPQETYDFYQPPEMFHVLHPAQPTTSPVASMTSYPSSQNLHLPNVPPQSQPFSLRSASSSTGENANSPYSPSSAKGMLAQRRRAEAELEREKRELRMFMQGITLAAAEEKDDTPTSGGRVSRTDPASPDTSLSDRSSLSRAHHHRSSSSSPPRRPSTSASQQQPSSPLPSRTLTSSTHTRQHSRHLSSTSPPRAISPPSHHTLSPRPPTSASLNGEGAGNIPANTRPTSSATPRHDYPSSSVVTKPSPPIRPHTMKASTSSSEEHRTRFFPLPLSPHHQKHINQSPRGQDKSHSHSSQSRTFSLASHLALQHSQKAEALLLTFVGPQGLDANVAEIAREEEERRGRRRVEEAGDVLQQGGEGGGLQLRKDVMTRQSSALNRSSFSSNSFSTNALAASATAGGSSSSSLSSSPVLTQSSHDLPTPSSSLQTIKSKMHMKRLAEENGRGGEDEEIGGGATSQIVVEEDLEKEQDDSTPQDEDETKTIITDADSLPSAPSVRPPSATRKKTVTTANNLNVNSEFNDISPELINALIKATKRGDATMVKTLCQSVPPSLLLAFINSKDKNGSTPIFHTVWPGHLYALSTLLELGADPNIQNVKQNTALHLACERQHFKLIHCLLRYHADSTIKNYENKCCHDMISNENERREMERYILNSIGEIKRGIVSSFKLPPYNYNAITPFQSKYYQQHLFQKGQTILPGEKEGIKNKELLSILHPAPPPVPVQTTIPPNPSLLSSPPPIWFKKFVTKALKGKVKTLYQGREEGGNEQDWKRRERRKKKKDEKKRKANLITLEEILSKKYELYPSSAPSNYRPTTSSRPSISVPSSSGTSKFTLQQYYNEAPEKGMEDKEEMEKLRREVEEESNDDDDDEEEKRNEKNGYAEESKEQEEEEQEEDEGEDDEEEGYENVMPLPSPPLSAPLTKLNLPLPSSSSSSPEEEKYNQKYIITRSKQIKGKYRKFVLKQGIQSTYPVSSYLSSSFSQSARSSFPSTSSSLSTSQKLSWPISSTSTSRESSKLLIPPWSFGDSSTLGGGTGLYLTNNLLSHSSERGKKIIEESNDPPPNIIPSKFPKEFGRGEEEKTENEEKDKDNDQKHQKSNRKSKSSPSPSSSSSIDAKSFIDNLLSSTLVNENEKISTIIQRAWLEKENIINNNHSTNDESLKDDVKRNAQLYSLLSERQNSELQQKKSTPIYAHYSAITAPHVAPSWSSPFTALSTSHSLTSSSLPPPPPPSLCRPPRLVTPNTFYPSPSHPPIPPCVKVIQENKNRDAILINLHTRRSSINGIQQYQPIKEHLTSRKRSSLIIPPQQHHSFNVLAGRFKVEPGVYDEAVRKLEERMRLEYENGDE